MTRRLVSLLLLAGCNQLWGIEPTELAPTVPPDRDGDSIADLDDNCPDLANPGQSDDDHDDVGDACDNCPLVTNRSQARVGDGDDLGDLCDPHPANDGDCLILYDSFSDPAQLESGWTARATQGTPMTEPAMGHVTLTPPATGDVAIFANGGDGLPLSGPFDVQMLANVTSVGTNAQVAATAAADLASGFRCWLQTYTTAGVAQGVIAQDASTSLPRPMSSAPYGSIALIRLTSKDPDGKVHLLCRIDFGIALGSAELATASLPATTGVGVIARSAPVEIDGIAIYRYQPGTACPQAVIR